VAEIPITPGSLMGYLEAATSAAAVAGSFVAAQFPAQNQRAQSFKHESDTLQVVTQTDGEAETMILSTLRAKYPDHGYFAEERGGDTVKSDFQWIVDPIDGTSNFARHIPFFCVTVCLTHKHRPVVGVVYEPLGQELFTAVQGQGAFLNGRRVQIPDGPDIEKAFVTVDRGKTSHEKLRSSAIMAQLASYVRSLRMPGSSALQACYVACGRFDAAVFNGLSYYDIAAASLIAEEASARITDFAGAAYSPGNGDLIISSHKLNRNLTAIVRDP
jgi:myo-inositol-1(or 4)-monophosphatase